LGLSNESRFQGPPPVEIYFSDKTRQKEKKCWCQTNLAKLKAAWRTVIFILHFKWWPDEQILNHFISREFHTIRGFGKLNLLGFSTRL
jgi:hypothetical protein